PFLKPFWRVRVGLPARVVHPGLALRRIDLPTLIIQPEKDTRVPASEGERLALASPRGEMVVIPGAGHTDVLQHPGLGELVREFVARVV
ncbi:MAG TPA: alpha/beta hydrolase, partial [Longimicrobiales bacterium]|nr:alpha/beta hydrolase [Longimicrobiales bacterium]